MRHVRKVGDALHCSLFWKTFESPPDSTCKEVSQDHKRTLYQGQHHMPLNRRQEPELICSTSHDFGTSRQRSKHEVGR